MFGEDEDISIENAFKYAVYRVKHERGLLDKTKLVSETERLPIVNGFRASKIGMYYHVVFSFKKLVHVQYVKEYYSAHDPDASTSNKWTSVLESIHFVHVSLCHIFL